MNQQQNQGANRVAKAAEIRWWPAVPGPTWVQAASAHTPARLRLCTGRQGARHKGAARDRRRGSRISGESDGQPNKRLAFPRLSWFEKKCLL